MEDFDQFIARDPADLQRCCTLCGVFRNRSVTNVRMHVEARHFPGIFRYTCPTCGRVLAHRIAFRSHSKQCQAAAVSP
jgi:hypothetical protein